jgi:hypothetical protein
LNDALYPFDLPAHTVKVCDVTLLIFGSLDLQVGASANHTHLVTVLDKAVHGGATDVTCTTADESPHCASSPEPAKNVSHTTPERRGTQPKQNHAGGGRFFAVQWPGHSVAAAALRFSPIAQSLAHAFT